MKNAAPRTPALLSFCPSASQRAALTLLEVVFSTMIVAVMTVVALDTLGAATRSGMSASNRVIATALADDLMAEVLTTPYSDLNDYANWEEELTGDYAGWTRRATVQRVVPADLTQATAGAIDMGATRIRVSVEYGGQTLAEQVVVRADID